MDLTWRALAEGDIPALVALAARCLAVDGGLPLAADETFLRPRFVADGGQGWAAVAGDGGLVAAGAVRVRDADGTRRAVLTGLVDPARRGAGIGGRLLDQGLAVAADAAGVVTVEIEALTAGAARLFQSRGLREVWAEEVMRFDLVASPLPLVTLPADLAVSTWTDDLAPRFFAVYTAAFRERPGFPGWTVGQWVDWTAGDDDFRARWSLLAGDAAFVTSAEGWIVQVGVRPEERGRGLGAALVTEALRRMREAGRTEALLDVNVDNPAGALYRRLGFTVIGRRARFA